MGYRARLAEAVPYWPKELQYLRHFAAGLEESGA